MRSEGDTELLPLTEAARTIGISARTLALWVERGLIPSVVCDDGARLVSRAELAQHVVRPEPTQPPDD